MKTHVWPFSFGSEIGDGLGGKLCPHRLLKMFEISPINFTQIKIDDSAKLCY